MKKVSSGEKLTFPAQTWNAFIDSADFTEGLRRSTKGRSLVDFLPDGIYYVKNATGQNLPRHSILGVDGPLWPPRTFFNSFSQGIVFNGVVPDEGDHSNKFVVLQEPLNNGEVGRCWADGVAPVKMRIDALLGDLADVITSDTTILQPASTGAQIVWIDTIADTGTGTGTGDDFLWALIRLGGGGGIQIAPFVYLASDVSGTGLDDDPVLFGVVSAELYRVTPWTDREDTPTTVLLNTFPNAVFPLNGWDGNSVIPSRYIAWCYFDGANWNAFGGGATCTRATKTADGVFAPGGALISDTASICGETIPDNTDVFICFDPDGPTIVASCCPAVSGTGT